LLITLILYAAFYAASVKMSEYEEDQLPFTAHYRRKSLHTSNENTYDYLARPGIEAKRNLKRTQRAHDRFELFLIGDI
jgi:hypothetical protein